MYHAEAWTVRDSALDKMKNLDGSASVLRVPSTLCQPPHALHACRQIGLKVYATIGTDP